MIFAPACHFKSPARQDTCYRRRYWQAETFNSEAHESVNKLMVRRSSGRIVSAKNLDLLVGLEVKLQTRPARVSPYGASPSPKVLTSYTPTTGVKKVLKAIFGFSTVVTYPTQFYNLCCFPKCPNIIVYSSLPIISSKQVERTTSTYPSRSLRELNIRPELIQTSVRRKQPYPAICEAP